MKRLLMPWSPEPKPNAAYCCCSLRILYCAATADMRPHRAAVLVGVAQQFIRTFFDENPLSQLGLVVIHNGVAQQLTELSSSPVGGRRRWRG